MFVTKDQFANTFFSDLNPRKHKDEVLSIYDEIIKSDCKIALFSANNKKYTSYEIFGLYIPGIIGINVNVEKYSFNLPLKSVLNHEFRHHQQYLKNGFDTFIEGFTNVNMMVDYELDAIDYQLANGCTMVKPPIPYLTHHCTNVVERIKDSNIVDLMKINKDNQSDTFEYYLTYMGLDILSEELSEI
jgi:hypothetical protein